MKIADNCYGSYPKYIRAKRISKREKNKKEEKSTTRKYNSIYRSAMHALFVFRYCGLHGTISRNDSNVNNRWSRMISSILKLVHARSNNLSEVVTHVYLNICRNYILKRNYIYKITMFSQTIRLRDYLCKHIANVRINQMSSLSGNKNQNVRRNFGEKTRFTRVSLMSVCVCVVNTLNKRNTVCVYGHILYLKRTKCTKSYINSRNKGSVSSRHVGHMIKPVQERSLRANRRIPALTLIRSPKRLRVYIYIYAENKLSCDNAVSRELYATNVKFPRDTLTKNEPRWSNTR